MALSATKCELAKMLGTMLFRTVPANRMCHALIHFAQSGKNEPMTQIAGVMSIEFLAKQSF